MNVLEHKYSRTECSAVSSFSWNVPVTLSRIYWQDCIFPTRTAFLTFIARHCL